MNWLRLTPPGELPLAIEDHDVELCRSARQDVCGDTPGAHRHFIAELNAFASGKRKSLRRGVRATDAPRQLLRPAALPRHASQRAKLDAPARGVKVEHALRELGYLGDAAGDGDARHGMGTR